MDDMEVMEVENDNAALVVAQRDQFDYEKLERMPAYRAVANLIDEFAGKDERYERILKSTREVILDSKRIISRLHNIKSDYEVDRKSAILSEVESRINSLVAVNFKAIAEELKGHDPYVYQRAYKHGMQEFVEALCLYRFVKDGNIYNMHDIQQLLEYQDNGPNGDNYTVLLTSMDFVLGVADFSGELMRKCITKLGIGEYGDCFRICNFVQILHSEFTLLSIRNKNILQKMFKLQQNVKKIEFACYQIHINGNEVPRHLSNIVQRQRMEPYIDFEAN